MKRIFEKLIKAYSLIGFRKHKKKGTAKFAASPPIKMKHVYIQPNKFSGGYGMSRSFMMPHLLEEESKKNI